MDLVAFSSPKMSVDPKKIRILETEDISQEIASIIQDATTPFVEETPTTKNVNWAEEIAI